MNVSRLKRLASFLDGDSFVLHLRTWFERVPPIFRAPPIVRYPYCAEPECGTIGCAVGLAIVMGVFKDDGLDFSQAFFQAPRQPMFVSGGVRYTGWDAVKAFFEIDDFTAASLFNASGYKKPVLMSTTVSRKIRKLIARTPP